MQREPHVLLWDICHAADAVAAFTRGKDLEDYKEDSFLRSAVERQLIILGEAVVQLSTFHGGEAVYVVDRAGGTELVQIRFKGRGPHSWWISDTFLR